MMVPETIPPPQSKASRTLVDKLIDIGIRQGGDQVLVNPGSEFKLPAELDSVGQLKERLCATLDKVGQLYSFQNGMGVAAPQIGASRKLAIVRPPDEREIVLLNPVVCSVQGENISEYEGCLSFFHIRGIVERPQSVTVQFNDLQGNLLERAFVGPLARLVFHEIDHLNGVLYLQHISNLSSLISIENYKSNKWQPPY